MERKVLGMERVMKSTISSQLRAVKVLSFAFAIICLLVSFSGVLPCSAEEPAPSGSRKIVERITPVYPELARRNQLAGTVKLRVVIGADGRPKDVEVIGGSALFVSTATDAVKKWKWAPADHATTETLEIKFNAGS